MMARKMPRMGQRRRSAVRRSGGSIASSVGARSGRRRTSRAMVAMKDATAIRPGIIAAWNISTMEASTIRA